MNIRETRPHDEGTRPAFGGQEIPTRVMAPIIKASVANEAHHSSAKELLDRFRQANINWVEAELERVPLVIPEGEHQQMVMPHVPNSAERAQLGAIDALGEALAFRRACDEQAQARMR